MGVVVSLVILVSECLVVVLELVLMVWSGYGYWLRVNGRYLWVLGHTR